jgi:hypothetical protein
MMGPRQVDQAALFYEISLERHVPATHLLRSIDRFVDLSDIRSHLAPFTALPVGLRLIPNCSSGCCCRLLLRHSLGASAVRRGSP